MKLSIEKQRLFVIFLLLLWCVILNSWRINMEGDALQIGLFFNLFLATLPLIWSASFQSAIAKKRYFSALFSFILWLLFFPNAPYLLTDLIHLAPRIYVPIWYILVILLSYAGTGTLLGYFSLMPIHAVIEREFGKTMGWIVVVGSLMLSGFGIYLGRFLRWNSWDFLTRPLLLLKTALWRFAYPGEFPHPLIVTFIYGGGLLLGYLALRVMITPVRSEEA